MKIELWLREQVPVVVHILVTILIALVVFYICGKLIKLIIKLMRRNFLRWETDAGVEKFMISLCKVVLNVVRVIVVAQILGLETSSVVAILGSAGLAIGLALQGSLANFAGGVLILVMKPFRMGDYIIYGDKEGTVSNIDIIYTRLLTPDNRVVILPNGTLANSAVINATQEGMRRLDLTVSVDYSENIKKVKDLLEELLNGHAMVLKEKDIDIFVNSFDPSSVSIGFRIWTKTEDYWNLRCMLLEEMKEAFDKHKIVIPYGQLDVNLKYSEELPKIKKQ